MRKHLMLLPLLFCLFFLKAQTKKHVIVLGFDGLSGMGLKQAKGTPNFDNFRIKGAYTYKAKAVTPTVSSPNWAAMINGAPPSVSKIKSNEWERKKIAGKSLCGQRPGEIFPTIFKVLRDQKSDAKIYCVYDWDAFARLANTESMDAAYDAKGEYDACNKACDLILKEQPDFLFVHFDHVDHAGHEFGHFTDKYYKSIQLADSLTGVVINALKKAGIYDQTYILVTADHGGIRKGHGGITLKEKRIPWMILGPDIAEGHQIAQTVHQFDTAPTISGLFGLTAPDCWKGKAIKSVFKQQ